MPGCHAVDLAWSSCSRSTSSSSGLAHYALDATHVSGLQIASTYVIRTEPNVQCTFSYTTQPTTFATSKSVLWPSTTRSTLTILTQANRKQTVLKLRTTFKGELRPQILEIEYCTALLTCRGRTEASNFLTIFNVRVLSPQTSASPHTPAVACGSQGRKSVLRWQMVRIRALTQT
jgi:hypothetical protein